jgi:hypothetical protein
MAVARPRKTWRDTEEKRALQLLAGAAHGCSQKTFQAQGFKVGLLSRLVRAGFAVAKPEIVKVGGRTLRMRRLTITDAGRRAVAE